MTIWKFGCNWGNGQPYFDDFIRSEKIILGWGHKYEINDIVLIAKGHNIIALTKVIGNRTLSISNREYKDAFEKYKIDYCDQVYYTKVDWIDLKEEDYFKYELQQGICQVRNTVIQNNAILLLKKYNDSNRLKNNQLFTLGQIANWQLKPENRKVELPSLQRGFVWKPKQIEDLWDSLFRGFPIGSFLLSDDEKGKYFLMDGQQRATAITLGYYNPWGETVKMWSLKSYIPNLWIDIEPTEKTESHKFVFRIITQSHPWGYQRKNNNAALSISDRNKALEIFEQNNKIKAKGYTSYPSTSVFPYDSDFPIPLSFLLRSFDVENTEDIDKWKDNVISLCKEYIPEHIKTKSLKFNNKEGYIEALKSIDISEIYKAVKRLNELEIHSNIVKNELLSEEEDGNAENPTLFVRLNSSGTVLNGDELIYSIYKAFFPDSKELVETIGLSFISAPLLISMVSRITQAELTNGEYVRKLDVRAFQNRIKDVQFRTKISELIGNKDDSLISLAFKKAVEILKDEQSSIIPAVLVKDLIKKNSEVFLFLVYWLYKNPKVEICNKQRTAILAKFTVLTWFGLDISRYVKETWGSATDEEFWITKFSKEQSEKFISVLVSPQLLDEYFNNPLVIKEAKHALNQSKKDGELFVEESGEIIKLFKKIFNDDIDEQRINSIWWEFFRRLFWGRSLIVFAQREYINNQFKDFNQIEDLQDTNVPWDWDHIYPNSWVYNQKDVNSSIRHWNNCIGNFRALSLGENRSENAHLSPKVRLEKIEVQNKSFVKSSDFEFWSKIDNRIYTNEKVEFHTKAVVLRTLNIYREWWDKLMIDRILY